MDTNIVSTKEILEKIKITQGWIKKPETALLLLLIFFLLLVLYLGFISKPEKCVEINNNLKEFQVAEKKEIKENKSCNYAEAEETELMPKYLGEYIRQNPNTVGYIKIEGTQIGYPVVQTDNNEYYMTYDFNKRECKSGAVFMDFRCDANDFSKTRNIILYGHRMKDGSMFKDLTRYLDEDFFWKTE